MKSVEYYASRFADYLAQNNVDPKAVVATTLTISGTRKTLQCEVRTTDDRGKLWTAIVQAE